MHLREFTCIDQHTYSNVSLEWLIVWVWVSYSTERTKNIGGFWNIHIDVGIVVINDYRNK